MSLEHVRNAILDEAKAEAERIEAEARARHDERLANARKALKNEFSRRLEQAKQETEQQAHRQLIQRRAEHNLALLKRRNETLDELFAEAARRLADLPDEQYRAVMERWMQKLPANAGGEVLYDERDHKRLAPLIEKLNAQRPADARLRPMQHTEALTGGILFRTEKFEIDLSVDARLRQAREALAPDVSKVVFSGDLTV